MPIHRSCVAFAFAAVSAVSFAQDAKPPASSPNGPVLVVDYAPLDRWFVDPKDRPFADALGMIPARVQEVVKDPALHVPDEVATLLTTFVPALGHPGRLVAKYNGDMPTGGFFGYGISYSALAKDEGDAKQMLSTVLSLLPKKGGPRLTDSKRFEGMKDLQTPAGLLSFGPRKGKDGWRFEVIFGTFDQPDEGVQILPSADAGVTPFVRARMNFVGLTPLKDLITQMAGQRPELEEQVQGAERAGLVGPDAIAASFIAGHTADRMVMRTTIHNALKHREVWRVTQTPLSPAIVRAVPADAILATIMGQPDDIYATYLKDLLGKVPQAEDVLAEITEHTGVDLRTDVVDALGGTAAAYLSDSTGGGGLGSAVALIGVRDRAKLLGALGKLSRVANDHMRQIPVPSARFELSAWSDGDAKLWSVRARGLPIPLELTLAMAGDWLVLAPTPQAAVAASRQALGKGDAGLASNAALRASGLPIDKAISLTFVDTRRVMQDGYTIMSLLGSGVANMVRSPVDDRDPGMIVPLFNDLTRDVRASASVGYWKGEELVYDSVSDRSALVNATATAGMLAKALPIIAVPIGAALAESRNGHLFSGRDLGQSLPWLRDRFVPYTSVAGAGLGPAGVGDALLASARYAPGWSPANALVGDAGLPPRIVP